MHKNQQPGFRRSVSEAARKPAPSLRIGPGTRRPRRGPHRKIRFAPAVSRLGKCVPPGRAIKEESTRRAEPVRPLSSAERYERYSRGGKPRATPAQARRGRKKAGHAQRRAGR